MLRERIDRLCNDEVIKHPDIDQCECLLEAARDELIRCARLRKARPMVVIEHYGCRVVFEGCLDDLSRMDRGAADCAAEQILDRDQSMPAVEMQHTKDLMLAGAQASPKGTPE